MDFDFNWILVPATLIFFGIWLLDKLVFKQYQQLKDKKQAALEADQNIHSQQQNFEQVKSKYPQLALSESVTNPDDPVDVTQARDQLSQAKGDAVRAHATHDAHKVNPIINWAYDFWPVLAVVLVVRSFLFEPFNIPSESMNPTLETGDFILVNKFAYGVRLPLINTKIIDTGAPEHGDVAVFRYPVDPSISYIKRIIGLPGDTISYQNGELFINGEKQFSQKGNEVNLPVHYQDASGQQQKIIVDAQQWVVNIASHRFITQYIKATQSDGIAQQFIQQYQQKAPLSLEQNWEVTVPKGEYFAMGDNRDQSADSRYWGFVPEANLTGKATYVWMHKAPGLNLPSFKRNGSIP